MEYFKNQRETHGGTEIKRSWGRGGGRVGGEKNTMNERTKKNKTLF